MHNGAVAFFLLHPSFIASAASPAKENQNVVCVQDTKIPRVSEKEAIHDKLLLELANPLAPHDPYERGCMFCFLFLHSAFVQTRGGAGLHGQRQTRRCANGHVYPYLNNASFVLCACV